MLPFTQCLFALIISRVMAMAVPISTDCPGFGLSRRTVFNIWWTCFTTVMTFVWVTVRPNVPPPGWKQVILRRVQMTFWYIIAPELVLAWAVRQWFAAREVAKTYTDNGWTQTHGFFLVMGGFTLINSSISLEKKPQRPSWFSTKAVRKEFEMQQREYDGQYKLYNLGPLSFDHFRRLVDEKKIEFPKITTEDILDRSKGSFILNAIAVLQFVSLCTIRGREGLAITELELVSLALASLNVLILFFLWDKPQGVQEPFKIYLNTVDDQIRIAPGRLIESSNSRVTLKDVRDRVDRTLERLFNFLRRPLSAFDWFTLPITLSLIFSTAILCIFPFAIAFLLTIIWPHSAIDQGSSPDDHRRRITTPNEILHKTRYQLASAVNVLLQQQINEADWNGSSSVLLRLYIVFPLSFLLLAFLLGLALTLFPLLFLAVFLFTDMFSIISTNTILPGANSVLAFYSPSTPSDYYAPMIIFALFGTIFGGMHCIAWNFVFPTLFEQQLWRISSLAITSIPLIAAPIHFFLANAEEGITRSRGAKVALSMLYFVVTILLASYVIARLLLIAQAIALLRNLPESALISVSWPKMIPHIS